MRFTKLSAVVALAMAIPSLALTDADPGSGSDTKQTRLQDKEITRWQMDFIFATMPYSAAEMRADYPAIENNTVPGSPYQLENWYGPVEACVMESHETIYQSDVMCVMLCETITDMHCLKSECLMNQELDAHQCWCRCNVH